MQYSLFIGRYQPLHAGHIKLIRKVLDEGNYVCIAIRNTAIDKNNPFDLHERMKMLEREFGKEIDKAIVVISVLPDISEVCYGRKVGWGIREIRLDEETEKISATEIRNVHKESNNI